MPAKRVHAFLRKAFDENLGPARAALRALGERNRSRWALLSLVSCTPLDLCVSGSEVVVIANV